MGLGGGICSTESHSGLYCFVQILKPSGLAVKFNPTCLNLKILRART